MDLSEPFYSYGRGGQDISRPARRLLPRWLAYKFDYLRRLKTQASQRARTHTQDGLYLGAASR